jgi:hypothetical protein
MCTLMDRGSMLSLTARVHQHSASLHMLFAPCTHVWPARPRPPLTEHTERASAGHSVPESAPPSPTPTESENRLSTIPAPHPSFAPPVCRVTLVAARHSNKFPTSHPGPLLGCPHPVGPANPPAIVALDPQPTTDSTPGIPASDHQTSP